MPTDVKAFTPLGVGGYTVTDGRNVRIMLRFLLPESRETVNVLLDDELAGLTIDKLYELRANGIEGAEVIRDQGLAE